MSDPSFEAISTYGKLISIYIYKLVSKIYTRVILFHNLLTYLLNNFPGARQFKVER